MLNVGRAPPSSKAIRDYQARYTVWIEDVRTHFKRLHRLLPGARGRTQVEWAMQNVGTVPAEGLIVEIEALGRLIFVNPKAVLKESSSNLPEAPEPPVGKQLHAAFGIWEAYQDAKELASGSFGPAINLPHLSLPRNFHEPARDAHAFYRREGSSKLLNRKLIFECGEFRHGCEPKNFKAVVLALGGAGDGALRFRVSARNLPVRVQITTSIRISTSSGQTEDDARAIVALMGRAVELRQRLQTGWLWHNR